MSQRQLRSRNKKPVVLKDDFDLPDINQDGPEPMYNLERKRISVMEAFQLSDQRSDPAMAKLALMAQRCVLSPWEILADDELMKSIPVMTLSPEELEMNEDQLMKDFEEVRSNLNSFEKILDDVKNRHTDKKIDFGQPGFLKFFDDNEPMGEIFVEIPPECNNNSDAKASKTFGKQRKRMKQHEPEPSTSKASKPYIPELVIIEDSNDAQGDNILDMVSCPICDQNFPMSEIEAHAASCGEAMEADDNDVDYNDVDHNDFDHNDFVKPPPQKNSKKYECSKCGRNFVRLKAMNNHGCGK